MNVQCPPKSTIYWNGGWWSRMSIWSFINYIVALENCVANPLNIESASILIRASNLSHADRNFIVFEVPRSWHGSKTIDPKLPTTKDILKVLHLQAKFYKPWSDTPLTWNFCVNNGKNVNLINVHVMWCIVD